MSTLVERVRQTVIEQGLFEAGDALVVAVSGGADSTALACVLAELAPQLGARIVCLAHLNHGLREAAAADEAFCAALAGRLGVPFAARSVDVRAEARAGKTSVEDAARTVRYLFLSEVATEHGASRIAVGHTRNDQAETVLLRLVRGAGPVGLAGIYPRAGQVVRPLLDARRSDVEAWLRERRLEWREDESNQDRSIPRNKVRHELLPWLAGAFGAGIVDVLARQAAVSRDDADWLEAAATETGRDLVIQEGPAITIDSTALLALHPALGRRLVLQALRRTARLGRRGIPGGGFVGFDHVEAVLALAKAGSGAATDLPGQRVRCEQGRLCFEAQAPDPAREGRRRGRPSDAAAAAAPEPRSGSAVSNPSGDAPGAGRRLEAGVDTAVNAGLKCAGSVRLEGHAPKGGRG